VKRHPKGSSNHILLAKWLGLEVDMMSMVGSETMTASDWMMLCALGNIGGQGSQKQVAEAFVQRLLSKKDIHAAATILLGLGDQNDAIEVYLSHKFHLEAVLLTCLLFPHDWGRQAELVKKWGEYAVSHGEQQLAIRW
jgi:hypothetical protein